MSSSAFESPSGNSYPSDSHAADADIPSPVPDAFDVRVSSLLERLSSAVAALLMLDVFGLSLARDWGRAGLRFRTAGLRFSSRGLADGGGTEGGRLGSDDRLYFDLRKAAATSLNAVGGAVFSTLVRVTYESSDVGLAGKPFILSNGLE